MVRILRHALFLPIIPFLHPVGAAYQIIFRKERDTVDTSMFIYRMILDCQPHPFSQLRGDSFRRIRQCLRDILQPNLLCHLIHSLITVIRHQKGTQQIIFSLTFYSICQVFDAAGKGSTEFTPEHKVSVPFQMASGSLQLQFHLYICKEVFSVYAFLRSIAFCLQSLSWMIDKRYRPLIIHHKRLTNLGDVVFLLSDYEC